MNSLSTATLLISLVSLPPPTVIHNLFPAHHEKQCEVNNSLVSIDSYTSVVLEQTVTPDFCVNIVNNVFVSDSDNSIFAKLVYYSTLKNGWDSSDSVPPRSESIDNAIQFVSSIPAVLPLPKPMLSNDGTVGLYWDNSVIYIDAQFESDNTLSFFYRDRSTGIEKYIDSIDITKIDVNWYYDNLGDLLHKKNQESI